MEKTEIILIIPPPFFIKMPHIGVAYLAANLRRNGFTVSVYDLSLKLYNNAKAEFRRFWQIDCVNSYFQSEIAEMVFNNFEGEIDEFIEDKSKKEEPKKDSPQKRLSIQKKQDYPKQNTNSKRCKQENPSKANQIFYIP